MAELTISQGLRQAKKLKGQLAELQVRASSNVSYRQDTKPAFDFRETLERMAEVRASLVELESRIAIANATTTISLGGDSTPLVYAVRILQELKGTIAWYKGLPCRAQETTHEDDWDYDGDKRTKTRTAWTCSLPEAERAAKVESLQAEFDAVNDLVERANHSTVLPD